MKTLKKLFFIITPKERKQFMSLIFVVIIMAFLEMVGLASILPFMSVVTNPSIIETNYILNYIYNDFTIFEFESKIDFIIFLGLIVFLILIISLFFKALTAYIQAKFVQTSQFNISKRLVECYLNQPYAWFLNRHSADLGKNILSEVAAIVGSGIRPMVELIAKSIVAIMIIILLLLVNLKITIIASMVFVISYGLTFLYVNKFLKYYGNKRLESNRLRFNAIVEAFGATKEIKISGLEPVYISNFSRPAKIYAESQVISSIISQIPRYILEAVAFGGILLLMLYFIFITGDFNNSIPLISMYAFAGYRLMPALQQIYSSITQIAFIGPSLDKTYHDLKTLNQFEKNQSQSDLFLKKTINLNNISYSYSGGSKKTIKDINLSISAKSTVGFIGVSGSGKTTTIDIILGLLEPQSGTLEIDGKVINKNNLKSWQNHIGYVPQHIYLSDDTISSNVAFGKSFEDISQDAVEKACKIANIHDFIMNELPGQYHTKIGERGVRLSGGQRQRIGIARALYNNPHVLIFDEATSSLDENTEKAVMDAVNKLDKDKTIIIITHRLNTVSKCDKIFLFEDGKIKNSGSFENLIKSYKSYDLNVNNKNENKSINDD